MLGVLTTNSDIGAKYQALADNWHNLNITSLVIIDTQDCADSLIFLVRQLPSNFSTTFPIDILGSTVGTRFFFNVKVWEHKKDFIEKNAQEPCIYLDDDLKIYSFNSISDLLS